MQRLPIPVLVVCLVAFSACKAVVPEITVNRELYLQTAIVDDGQPLSFIAVPADSAYLEIARALAQRIGDRFGARPEVRLADEVTDEELKAVNAIAIGVFAVNPVSERLYRRQLIACDYAWPGGDNAWVVRTVHNPWLSGTNVVFLGGPSLEGCRQAADWFAQRLDAEGSGSIGPIIQVAGENLPEPPDDAAVSKRIETIETGTSSRSMGRTATRLAGSYFRTGHPAWAALFGRAMRRLEALQVEEGAADDVRTCVRIFHQWDCIEEGPAFTDRERLDLTNLFHRFAHRLRYANRQVKSSGTPHGNNWNAAGASYAALYFNRYYPDLSIGKRLLENLDRYYEPNMTNWKVNEDCPGYGNITLRDNVQWALHRPDPRYFENGALRMMADYDMRVTNNLGEVSGFGDARGIGRKYLVPAYPTAAWIYRDGRYLWWWDHHGGKPTAYWVPPEVLPRVRPDDLLGITTSPLANWIYTRGEDGKDRSFSIQECYDKASFRAGFDADDAYMSVSGFSYGFHSHADANAIINLGGRGRTFLYDDGYMIPSLSEHNTVIPLKDGWAGRVPELSRLAASTNFVDVGLFRSDLDDYNGLRWGRCVIWLKPDRFFVIDDLTAQEEADYGLQCIWRSLGNAQLGGRRWAVRNGEAVLYLTSCSDASLSQKQSAGTSLNAKPFPLDKARKLVQAADVHLKPGESYRFANLLSVQPADDPWSLTAPVPLDGTSCYLGKVDDEIYLMGVRSTTQRLPHPDLPPIHVSARVFCLTDETLWAAGTTELGLTSRYRISASAPVSLRLDLATGRAVVVVLGTKIVTLMIGERKVPVTPGRHTIQALPLESHVRRLVKDRLRRAHLKALAGAGAPARPVEDVGLTRLWRHVLRDSSAPGSPWHLNDLEILDADGDGRHEVFVAGTDSIVYGIRPDGSRAWSFLTGGAINDLATIAPEPGRGASVIAASDDKTLYVIDSSGEQTWSVAPPPRTYARAGYRGVKPYRSRLTVVFTADLVGDPVPEIIVGSANWRTYVYTLDGDLVWDEVCWAHTPTCGTAADLDGDGRREVIMGNSYNATRIYSADGKLIGTGSGSWHAGPTAVTVADFDGNGKAEMVVGDRKGKIWFDEWKGRSISGWETGGAIADVASADLDGNGRIETVAASDNYLLYCFDSAGQPLWQVNLLDACRDIDLADVAGDSALEILCACEDNTVRVIDASGKEVARHTLGGWVRHVKACELDGNGDTKEMVVTCDDGAVYGLQVAVGN